MNLQTLKEECIIRKIPIINNESIKYIAKLINDFKFSSVLEIGSGLGYSSYFILENTKVKNVISLEKDVDKYNFIKTNLSKIPINFINVDAFIYEPNSTFDFIFIDGPKNKQEILFKKYSYFLNKKGIIIIDNIWMNRLKQKNQTTRIKKLINKNEIFKKFLSSQKDWNISFLDLGDGLAICSKK